MKNISYLTIILISFLAVGCSKVLDPVKKIGLGSRVIDYQADEKLDSLIIPPDLTQPNSLSLITQNENLNSEIEVVNRVENVEVMRDKYRRWLVVDMPSSEVLSLSKEFFRSYGFKIEKENQKIGIFETDYLEIETKVPDKSLGMIRAALSKALKTQYGLPIADKYRVRVEPTDYLNQSEIYLTLTSIGEIVSGTQRLWQPREKDVEIETEMLLTLMVFLGSDRDEAITKIQSNINIDNLKASVTISDVGYPILTFPFNKKESWKLLGWGLDELEVDIEDRDPIEGSYFINAITKKGFFSKLINSIDSPEIFQIIVKEVGEFQTQVFFVDLSEKNDQDTKDYSIKLFNNIAQKF